jgi:DNA polymerase-4
MLYEHSRGIDDSPVVPFYEPNSMSREVTFEDDTRDIYFIKETLFELTADVVERVKGGGYTAKTVVLKVRFFDFHTITRSLTLKERTDSFNDVWSAVSGLLERVDFAKPVRLVGVKVENLQGTTP